MPSVDEAQVLDEIRRIAVEQLEPGTIGDPDGRLTLDSLSAVVLAVGLEDRYRIRLREEDTAGLQTVRDLAALVVRRIGETRC
jgi:acyl carrier protein